jgi:hypothetical protein
MSCVLDYSTKPPVLKCTICGGTDPFSLPMTVTQMSAIIKVFEGKHAFCKPCLPKWVEPGGYKGYAP